MARKEWELLFNLSAKQNSSFSSTFKAAQSALVETQGKIQLLNKVQSDISAYQKQQQAVDAGRDGEREHCVADLAQKTERQNTRKLKQIVRKDASFGSAEQENTKQDTSQQYNPKIPAAQRQYWPRFCPFGAENWRFG